jgi:hypothetical protein
MTSALAKDTQQKQIKFKVYIYKNDKCTGKEDGEIDIDTAKSCTSYSYVDSKGVTTVGSQNNIRCYADKVVYDKYPFSSKCSAKDSVYHGQQVTEYNHAIPLDGCLVAPSHEGNVYEKLVDYTYPGNENCSTK